jgi:NADH-quinone oxidoreductase subunit C
VTAEHAVTRIREALGVEATGEDPTRPPDVRHLVATVPLERWVEAVRVARDALGCRYFCHLTAVDWKAEGFDVVCRVENLDTHLGLTLKTRVARDAPCPTVTGLYRGALWMERECHELFGIRGPSAAQGLRRRHAVPAVPMSAPSRAESPGRTAQGRPR